MKILAIETATEACSAALLLDGEAIQRYTVQPRGHAQLVLPMVEELLAEAQMPINALDGLAFGRGPGAFTGVRIAAGVIQGLAVGADIPVAPVSTLATLAQGAMRETGAERVLAGLDARMGEVYWATYEKNTQGMAQLLGEELVCSPQQVPVPPAGHWYAAGHGWREYKTELEDQLQIELSGMDGNRLPQAIDTAILGETVLAAKAGVPAHEALPVYLRDKVADKPLSP